MSSMTMTIIDWTLPLRLALLYLEAVSGSGESLLTRGLQYAAFLTP